MNSTVIFILNIRIYDRGNVFPVDLRDVIGEANVIPIVIFFMQHRLSLYTCIQTIVNHSLDVIGQG